MDFQSAGRPVVKAFNNIMAYSLIHSCLPKGSKSRIALPSIWRKRLTR
jgi:hypothetical protein